MRAMNHQQPGPTHDGLSSEDQIAQAVRLREESRRLQAEAQHTSSPCSRREPPCNRCWSNSAGSTIAFPSWGQMTARPARARSAVPYASCLSCKKWDSTGKTRLFFGDAHEATTFFPRPIHMAITRGANALSGRATGLVTRTAPGAGGPQTAVHEHARRTPCANGTPPTAADAAHSLVADRASACARGVAYSTPVRWTGG